MAAVVVDHTLPHPHPELLLLGEIVWSLGAEEGFLSTAADPGIGVEAEDLDASKLFFLNEGGFEARDEGLDIVKRDVEVLVGSELRWVTSSINANTSAA